MQIWRNAALAAFLFLNGCGGGASSDNVASAPAPVASENGGDTPTAPIVDNGNSTVRFVAIGDTGRGTAGQYAVADAIARFCADAGCDFGVMLGDNIYDSGASSVDDAQFQSKFEQPYASLSFPFYVVLGNHDYGNRGAGDEFWKGQVQVDYSARSSKWRMPAAHYRAVEGPVEFFAIDTTMQLYARDAAQRRDVAQWLSESKAPWKIVLGHHPYLSNGPHGNAGRYDGVAGAGSEVKDFAEGVFCGKADAYLSGHDHSLQWLTPTCNGTALMVSGTGANPTTVSNRNAAYYQAAKLGFLYVVAESGRLTTKFVNTDGQIEYTRVLTK